MVRDPLNVIPSGLSLVTGVLDKRFGFWNLNKEKREQYIERLYKALVTLLQRFHEDWSNNNINRSNVFIVRYDHMMNDFDQLMNGILKFIDQKPSEELITKIKKTAEDQRNYKSNHGYDLNKFGLTEKRIRKDCYFIYETFLTE